VLSSLYHKNSICQLVYVICKLHRQSVEKYRPSYVVIAVFLL